MPAWNRTGFFLDLGDFNPILELVRCEKPATRKAIRNKKRTPLYSALDPAHRSRIFRSKGKRPNEGTQTIRKPQVVRPRD
ncbi:hypothetical protein LEP1GSC058_2872 [Leptospira fainei serovar Hurstbridge str. BUT 6]|uniref:Uncharacterized protein n=1 Tax=Leptospira fainei serovar Hurstbridge str. BUT 6 TaxID=1193011 RepID=S3VDD7_9LEPT|nr:hypothetical protein LEP1GSC058_2872 [Leptospira fainei serovar Hurstbridge str. BUT 6]